MALITWQITLRNIKNFALLLCLGKNNVLFYGYKSNWCLVTGLRICHYGENDLLILLHYYINVKRQNL